MKSVKLARCSHHSPSYRHLSEATKKHVCTIWSETSKPYVLRHFKIYSMNLKITVTCLTLSKEASVSRAYHGSFQFHTSPIPLQPRGHTLFSKPAHILTYTCDFSSSQLLPEPWMTFLVTITPFSSTHIYLFHYMAVSAGLYVFSYSLNLFLI